MNSSFYWIIGSSKSWEFAGKNLKVIFNLPILCCIFGLVSKIKDFVLL